MVGPNVSIDWRLVAKNIRSMRHESQMTQTACAELSGVAVASIIRIEQERPVRVQTLRKVCQALDIGWEHAISFDLEASQGVSDSVFPTNVKGLTHLSE